MPRDETLTNNRTQYTVNYLLEKQSRLRIQANESYTNTTLSTRALKIDYPRNREQNEQAISDINVPLWNVYIGNERNKLCMCLIVYVCLSSCLTVCRFVYLSLFLYLSMSQSLTLSVSLFLSLALSLSALASLPTAYQI